MLALKNDPGAGRLAEDNGQFSLAGAQAKTALYKIKNSWAVPQGRTPTTHILKPETGGIRHIASNEHFCLELARRLDLAAAISVVERDFVAAAESLGESRTRILRSELLPNVAAPLLVEANLRLTFSIGLIAGIAFLGFTADPGAANWGLMINENRKGLAPNHWGVTLPVIAIALLTIGTGLIGDGLSRAAAGIDRARGDS